MTRCNCQALLSCLPIIGPPIGLSNALLTALALADIVQKIDPTGILAQQTTAGQHTQKEEEKILKQFRKECTPFFKETRLYSICAIAGNAFTISASVFAPPIIGTIVFGSCTLMVAGHSYNFYVTTRALRTMEAYR